MNIKVYNNLINLLKVIYYEDKNISDTIELIKIIARFSFTHYTQHLYSIECEVILNEIASSYVKTITNHDLKLTKSKKNILHVFSTVSYGGGHTRLASNWIKNSFDDESHHLLLLHQIKKETPDFMIKTIKDSCGKIISYNDMSNEIEKAENLRSISYNFDYIVLHINMDEVICNLAFGDKKELYNVIFMNHADHLFWLGQSIAKSYLQLGKSGQILNCLKRDLNHSSILPIPLNKPEKYYTKEESCQILGLDSTKNIFLSIASPYKYISDKNVNFLKMAKELINNSINSILIVIGPDKDKTKVWRDLYEHTEGRVNAIGYINENLSLYHFACDVYLDSFPIGSYTATLEPALIGKPCVTLNCNSIDPIESFIEAGFVVDTQKEFILKAINFLNKKQVEIQFIIESYHIKENWQKYLDGVYRDIEEDKQININLESFEKKCILDRFDNFSLEN